MKEYRIYTEDRPNLPAIVSRRFDAFTILRGLGHWEGTQEHSAVIVILNPPEHGTWLDNAKGNIRATCEAIRRENEQEADTVQTVEQVTITEEEGEIS